MNFGLFNLAPLRDPATPPAQILDETVERVRFAEELGFDMVWFAEHHFSNLCLTPSPMLMAAYCAGRTERIRVGTGVVVLPLYQPIRLVDEISYLDMLSGGRLVVGVGSGSQNHESVGFDTTIADAHERFGEAMDIIEMALEGGVVVYRGKHFTVPEAAMILRPLQAPRPEIYIAGMSRDADIVRRIARKGYVPFASAQWLPVGTVLETRRQYEAGFRELGRDPATMPFAIQRVIYVTDSRADALDAAEHARYTYRIVTSLKGRSPEFDGPFVRETPHPGEQSIEEIAEAAMIGDPERIAAALAVDIEQLRPTHISCFMHFGSIDQRRTMRSMERFTTEVIPLLERRFGNLDALGPLTDPPDKG